jgi:hypothetical protein
MIALFPRNAEPVSVEWLTREGGVRAVAWTNERGVPFLGVFTLNRLGQPNGLPCWYRRSRFLSDIVIGFNGEKPVIVRLYVRVRSWGLEATIRLTRYATQTYQYHRNLFAPWHTSPPPSFGFIASNQKESYPAGFITRFLYEDDI